MKYILANSAKLIEMAVLGQVNSIFANDPLVNERTPSFLTIKYNPCKRLRYP